jgi:tape measure domain-containing protein
MNVNGGPLDFVAALDNSQFGAAMREMRNDVSRLTGDLQTQGAQIESFASKAAAAAAGFFSTQAAAGFVKQMVQVRGEFQQIEIAFNTMLGSKEKADQLMAEAVKLAAITPFNLQDVAKGAKQLLAYGFAADDITKELTKLGNVASGVGSQLGDIVYLYGTMKAGGRVTQVDLNQFAGRGIPIYDELAKVIGRTTGEVRAYVSAGKIGFPEVEKAFANMTGQGGKFFNLMQEQSKSLTGQLANLGDAWDMMLNSLGKSQEGIIGDGIQAAIELVQNYQRVIEIIELLVITYGSYRAALLITTTVTSGMSAVELIHYNILVMKERLMGILNSKQTALAVSTAAYTAVLAALVSVGYSLIQYQDAAEISENSLTEARAAGVRAVENETERIDDLIKTIKDHNSTKRQQKDAYDTLLETTKGALDQYSLEEIAAGQGAEAIDKYKESVRKATEANREFADYKEIQTQIDAITEKGIKSISIWDQAAISIGNFGKALKMALTGDFSGLARMMDKELAFKDVEDAKIKDLKGAQGRLISNNPEVQKLLDAEKAAKAAEEEAKAKEILAAKTAEQLAKEAAAAKKYNALLEKRKDLEREVGQDLAGARAAALSEEDKAVAAINAKYDDRLAQIEKLNKGLKPADQISTKPVESARVIELGVAGVDQIINGKGGYKEELERKKQLFEDYENAKADFGQTKADQMYKEEIGEYTSFVEFIQKDIEKRKGDRTLLATKKNEVAAPILIDETRNQQIKFQQLLKDTETFEESRNLIIEKALQQAADLRAKGYEDQAQQAIANGEAELERFDSSMIQQISGYKMLFEGFTRMSTDAINEYIQKAKQKADADLAAGLISQKAYHLVIKAINNAKANLNAAIPNQLRGFAQIFRDLASQTDGLSSGLTNVLSILGDMVSSAADVKQGIADTKDAIANYKEAKEEAGGGLLGTLSAGLAIAGPASKAIGAVVGVVKGITGFFKAAKESAKQAAAEVQTYQDNSIKGEIAYNQLLRERARTMKSIGDLSLAELRTQQSILAAQKSQAQSDEAMLLARIRASGQQITGIRTEKYGGFLGIGRKTRTVQDTAGLQGSTYEELEELYTKGKLTDATKAWFEELKRVKDETQDISDAAKEAQDAINQALTGTTASSIADAIINGFKQGKRTAADFADDFKTLMSDAMYRAMSDEFLNKAIAEFYTRFAEKSKDGLTDNEIKDLQDEYTAIINKGIEQANNIDKVIGKPNSSDSSSGGIKAAGIAASQESVDVNNTIARSNYEQLKSLGKTALDHLAVATQGIDYLNKIEQHTLRGANNTDKLNSKLDQIINNTASQSGRGLPIGQ